MKKYRKESTFPFAMIWAWVVAIAIVLILFLIKGNPFKDLQGTIYGISLQIFLAIFFVVVIVSSLLITFVYRAIFYKDVLGFDISINETQLILKKNGTKRIDLTKISEFGRFSFGRANTAFYVIQGDKETAVCTPDNIQLLKDVKEVLENKGLAYVRTYEAKLQLGKNVFEKYVIKPKEIDVNLSKKSDF